MQPLKHIKLSKHVDNALNTRSAVRSILANINNGSSLVSILFDFDKIDFVSRNAMHEILNTKQTLENQDLMVVFENMNQQVQSMYKLVSEASSNNKRSVISRYNVTSRSEFNRLVTI